MLEDPFPDLQIEDSSFLDKTNTRYKCKKCTKSRKFFCYSCCTPNPTLKDLLPKVKLPVKIDIIKHQKETEGKSTCPHAAILAPDDVTVYTFPCIPDYDPDKVVLVFPCKEASTLKNLVATHSIVSISTSDTASDTVNAAPSANVPDLCQDNKTSPGKHQVDASDAENSGPQGKRMRVIGHRIERAVFIDSTWNQTSSISRDGRLKKLRRVELKDRETQFWRCQEGLSLTYLSTIEAIYYFMREYHDDVLVLPYSNQYDNLLLFFVYLYHIIREQQDGGKKLKAYQRKLTQS